MKVIILISVLFLMVLPGSALFSETEIYRQAQQNIEKYRKADFSLRITGIRHEDLNSITIDVSQTSHEFHSNSKSMSIQRKFEKIKIFTHCFQNKSMVEDKVTAIKY